MNPNECFVWCWNRWQIWNCITHLNSVYCASRDSAHSLAEFDAQAPGKCKARTPPQMWLWAVTRNRRITLWGSVVMQWSCSDDLEQRAPEKFCTPTPANNLDAKSGRVAKKQPWCPWCSTLLLSSWIATIGHLFGIVHVESILNSSVEISCFLRCKLLQLRHQHEWRVANGPVSPWAGLLEERQRLCLAVWHSERGFETVQGFLLNTFRYI